MRATRLIPKVLRLAGMSELADRFTLYEYQRNRLAFSDDYYVFRNREILRALTNTQVLEGFRTGQPLLSGYGLGLDERIVEYPWFFSHLNSQAEYLLDAGSILNQPMIMSLIQENELWKSKQIHILTLAPEPIDYSQSRISHIYDDLRSIPMRDHLYKTVVCISTLEHIGFDNSFYIGATETKEHNPLDFIKALREMRRVLASGGQFLLTVPYGQYEDLGEFQNFDEALLQEAITNFGPAVVKIDYYRYVSDGWVLSNAAECKHVRYNPRLTKGVPGRLTSGEPAAAGAVACVRLQALDE